MIFKTKFESITLVENGLLLSHKSKTEQKILFSELDEIYITINKIKPFYVFLIALFAIGLALYSLLQLEIDLILPLAFLTVVAIILKMNNFKSYGLKMRLKNGETFEKQIPSKTKYETIELVNTIRKEIYNYKIKDSHTPPLQFSH